MTGPSTRVLVVNENPDDFGFLLNLFFQIPNRSYQTDNVSTAQEGLEALRRQEHDVILVDFKPGSDFGFDFLRQAIQKEKSQVPIIILSGLEGHDLDLESMNLGAADFLNKNKLDPDILERSIRYALERKKTEKALQRLATIVESSEDAIYSTTLDGVILSWNPGAQHLYGYTPEEIGGRDLSLLMAPDREIVFRQILQTVKNEKGVSNFGTVHRTRNGDDLYVTVTVSPIKDSTGQVGLASIIARDVTIQRKVEEVQVQLASILQQTTDAVIGVDLDGNIYQWNRGAQIMFGYEFEEIVGQPVSLLSPEALREDAEKNTRIILGGQIIADFETFHVKKNGETFQVSITLSPLHNSRGKIFGASVIIRDISQRKKAEELQKKHEEQMRLTQKMDAIGRLAGGVAHDFNNLLTVIGGNADFLMSNLKKDGPQWEELEEIKNAVRHGAALTKQLLVFGKKQVSQPQPVNLNDLSVEMNKMLKRVINETIHLSILQGLKLRSIMIDPGLMQQVILNLVLNACDAMPKGGELILETGNIPKEELELEHHPSLPAGDYVRLNVTDSGSGMDLETQKHIFEPFFTTKTDKGTGLGLATVYGIVTNWSGHLFVHSRPDMGSTFTIYFPALPEQAINGAKPKQIALIPHGVETLLVVEDEDPLRKIFVRTMRTYGYKILEAANGQEALKIAGNHPERIHLLMTDVMMPKMNGKELADEIKKSRPKTKILFISGYAREVLTQQGYLESGIHLIQKPFELDDLAMEIRKILDEK
jgi:PAS domain S-box-containing protein